MCEEESEDHEAVAKLLEINDSIHRTLERYKLIKKGDWQGAEKIPRGTLGTSGAGVTKNADNELSLIDLGSGEETAAPPQNATRAGSSSLEDDLLGLSLDNNNSSREGQITLGQENSLSEWSTYPVLSNLFMTLYRQRSSTSDGIRTQSTYKCATTSI